MFLTRDELVTLTGLRRPSAQARWLKAHRIKHVVNAAGHPVIARAWLEERRTATVTELPVTNLQALPGRA